MVNTFLVDLDYRQSARKLDTARLGKQRSEALIIYNCIISLYYAAQIFNIAPFPKHTHIEREIRSTWIKTVLAAYKNSALKAIVRCSDGQFIYYTQNSPIKVKSDEIAYRQGDIVFICSKKSGKILTQGHYSQFVNPNDFLLTLGYCNHPAVLMWLGYEVALQDYTNAHIEIWIERGYNNNMKMFNLTEKIVYPFWHTKIIVDNFQAALIQREIERNERRWYVLQSDFILAWIVDLTKCQQFWSMINNYHSIPKEHLLSFAQFSGFLWL